MRSAGHWAGMSPVLLLFVGCVLSLFVVACRCLLLPLAYQRLPIACVACRLSLASPVFCALGMHAHMAHSRTCSLLPFHYCFARHCHHQHAQIIIQHYFCVVEFHILLKVVSVHMDGTTTLLAPSILGDFLLVDIQCYC